MSCVRQDVTDYVTSVNETLSDISIMAGIIEDLCESPQSIKRLGLKCSLLAELIKNSAITQHLRTDGSLHFYMEMEVIP